MTASMNTEDKVRVWFEITNVVLKHYLGHIEAGDSDGHVAWSIMQDVRKHLGLSEEDTFGETSWHSREPIDAGERIF